MKFLYDGLGTIDPSAPRDVRLEQLSHVLTGPKNGRLARTVVNRLWARFMARPRCATSSGGPASP